MSKAKTLPKRSQVKEQDRWNLATLFKSDKEWEAALRGLPESHTSTRRRQRPRTSAALNPAGPAPTMITSNSACFISDVSYEEGERGVYSKTGGC